MSDLSIEWSQELPKITAAAAKMGIDPFFVQAIRAQENGPVGHEFGVITTTGYDNQLQICVSTISHRLASYTLNPLTRDAFQRIRYTTNWIAYFASIWAPVPAPNDPSGINKNWYPNVCDLYAMFRGE